MHHEFVKSASSNVSFESSRTCSKPKLTLLDADFTMLDMIPIRAYIEHHSALVSGTDSCNEHTVAMLVVSKVLDQRLHYSPWKKA